MDEFEFHLRCKCGYEMEGFFGVDDPSEILHCECGLVWNVKRPTDEESGRVLAEENERLRAALTWYADYDRNYNPEIIDRIGYLPIDEDGGKRARAALVPETRNTGIRKAIENLRIAYETGAEDTALAIAVQTFLQEVAE